MSHWVNNARSVIQSMCKQDSLNRCPGDAVRDLLLTRIPSIFLPRMIERLPIDVLSVLGKMVSDRDWQLVFRQIGHGANISEVAPP